jgi:hypothetical protein
MACAADLIRLGVEQKLKRRCSLPQTKSERFVAAIPKPGTGTPIFDWLGQRFLQIARPLWHSTEQGFRIASVRTHFVPYAFLAKADAIF